MGMTVANAYADQAAQVFTGMPTWTEFTRPANVGQAVWRAATDLDCPLRLPAGAETHAREAGLAWARTSGWPP